MQSEVSAADSWRGSHGALQTAADRACTYIRGCTTWKEGFRQGVEQSADRSTTAVHVANGCSRTAEAAQGPHMLFCGHHTRPLQ
jgi:hypothetical protein